MKTSWGAVKVNRWVEKGYGTCCHLTVFEQGGCAGPTIALTPTQAKKLAERLLKYARSK